MKGEYPSLIDVIESVFGSIAVFGLLSNLILVSAFSSRSAKKCGGVLLSAFAIIFLFVFEWTVDKLLILFVLVIT